MAALAAPSAQSIAAKAAPDGYTFFIGAVHHAIAPSFYKLDYNIETDLVPLTIIANPPQVIVVNPSRIKAENFKDFLTYVRSNPGKLNYASAGNGTSHHLAGELFKIQSKTFIVNIPYRGAGPALSDLIAGNVDMMFDGMGSSAQHIRSGASGHSRWLHQSARRRFRICRRLPKSACPITLCRPGTESGASRARRRKSWIVCTPRSLKRFRGPELRDIWASQVSETTTMSQDQFAKFLASEIKRWAQVTKTSGAKLD